MNVVESNRLIAEFMGLNDQILSTGDVHSWIDAPFYYTTENSRKKVVENIAKYAKYHEDWGWLMPVFKKIHELPSEEVEGVYKIHAFHVKIDGIYCSVSHGKTGEIIVEDDSGDMFDNLYCVIVSFIEWYNENWNV